jgi:hypothetical protein
MRVGEHGCPRGGVAGCLSGREISLVTVIDISQVLAERQNQQMVSSINRFLSVVEAMSGEGTDNDMLLRAMAIALAKTIFEAAQPGHAMPIAEEIARLIPEYTGYFEAARKLR